MPDKEYRLTTIEKLKAQQWIESKLVGDLQCQICKRKSWALLEHVVSLKVHTPGIMISGGMVEYPQLQLCCDNCGNTLLVNAVKAGVVQSELDATPEKEESPNG